jgi:hypothetical protein
MLRDLLKKLARFSLAFIVWVFIFSFKWNDQNLFERSHAVLVDNSLVEFLGEQLQATWERVVLTTQQTYSSLSEKSEQAEKE